ncbi:MAG TPA: hypothetical protein VFU12_00505 [Glycomyces sp.]|nr:hypothetical protein [Glycomyces sp.]
MGYTAPDPSQFDGMEQAYSYMGPLAAAQIVVPRMVFGMAGPGIQRIANIIFMNQTNPGLIMQGAAHWLKTAEKYLAAKEALDQELANLDADSWEGYDRDQFDDKAAKVGEQLTIIAAFAMHIGISLFAIAAIVAVMVPLMLAFATTLMALAITYKAIMATGIGAFAALSVMAAAKTVIFAAIAVLEPLDKAIDMTSKTLAAFIAGNMTASWVAMAANGNIINPVDTLGSTGFSMLQGLAQMGLRNLMAPAGGPGAKATPINNLLTGFTGVQGMYNIGNNIAGDVNPDGPNAMTDAGIDVMALDFIPNNHGFEEKARTGDELPDYTSDFPTRPDETGDGDADKEHGPGAAPGDDPRDAGPSTGGDMAPGGSSGPGAAPGGDDPREEGPGSGPDDMAPSGPGGGDPRESGVGPGGGMAPSGGGDPRESGVGSGAEDAEKESDAAPAA